MAGLNLTSGFTVLHGIPASEIIIAILSITIVFFAPNSNQISERYRPSIRLVVYMTAIIFTGLLFLNSSTPREFIYFDF